MKRLKISLLVLSLMASPLQARALELTEYHYNSYEPLTITGQQLNEQFGSSVAVVDINGDGFEDLVVGAPYYSQAGKEKRGKVEVYLGPIGKSPSQPSFTILGANSNDLLGTSLSFGNINGDIFQDLIIGAPGALKSVGNRSGATYGFLGANHFFLSEYDFSVYQPDISIYGPHNNSYYGLSTLGYDINNDHTVDIVSGAPLAKNTDGIVTGNVYVVSWDNVQRANPVYDLSTSAPNTLISGDTENSLFGSSLAQGNFDSNTRPDLAVGAYAYSNTEHSETGAVYMFLNFTTNTTNRKKPDNLFVGEHKNQWFGFNISSIQVNNDRFDDLSIASFAFKEKLKLAKLWFVRGSSAVASSITGLKNLPPQSVTSFEGKIHNLMMGSSVSTSDINRDGALETIVSYPNIGSSNTSYISIISEASPKPYQEIKSLYKGDWFGQKIIVTDFNRDGAKDLVVSAPMRAKNDQASVGAVDVFFMKEGPLNGIEMTAGERPTEEIITRAEAVALILEKFKFSTLFSDFIDSCYNNLEFCFFVFSSQSRYDEISLEPQILLYPDVPTTNPYYEDIILATMLGLVNGNLSDTQSPFKPDSPLTRIQGLKMLSEAMILERNSFFDELISNLGGDEVLAKFQPIYNDVKKEASHMWWYYKYINVAYQLGILDKSPNFRPDESMTKKEFTELLDRMYQFAR